VLKHLGALIIVINCILMSAFVSGCVDCTNKHGMNNKKITFTIFKISSSKRTLIHTVFEPIMHEASRLTNELGCIVLWNYKFILYKYNTNSTRHL
jgi:hypothetical protein